MDDVKGYRAYPEEPAQKMSMLNKELCRGNPTDVLSFPFSFFSFSSLQRGDVLTLVLGVCRSKSWGIQLEADGVGGKSQVFYGSFGSFIEYRHVSGLDVETIENPIFWLPPFDFSTRAAYHRSTEQRA